MKPVEPKLWTVLSLLQWTEVYFQKHTIDSPRHTAELLLAHLLGLERLQLYLQHDRPVSEKELADYKVMIKRRVGHEPVQYITGVAYCLGLKFDVNSSVLIPRFDTETLIEKAIDIIKTKGVDRVIDVGTGSGLIAISIAHFVPNIRIGASDISTEALAVAKHNLEKHGLIERVELREGDLLLPWMTDARPEEHLMITANLPYVREREWECLSPEVKLFEPKQALVSGIEGLDHYERIIGQLQTMENVCTVLLELGIEQQVPLSKRIVSMFPTSTVEVIKDLSGNDRCLIFTKKKDDR